MRQVCIFFTVGMLLLSSQATAQQVKPPDGFLDTAEIIRLLEFENFDDLHSLEDSDGNRIKPLHENIPFRGESYEDGKYGHHNENGLTDTADYFVEDHSVCLVWKWSNNGKYEFSNGRKYCFYIQQLGNCYLPQDKSRFARPVREIKSSTFIFVKFGDQPECSPLTS